MIRGRPDYETLEHTADVKVRVRGATLAELFERAAAVMFDLMADLDGVGSEAVALEVEAEGEDRGELLVAWLTALLAASMGRGDLYGAFAVDALEERRVRGRAWGEPWRVERHGMKTEVKAATYHDLVVAERDGAFVAEIVFDI